MAAPISPRGALAAPRVDRVGLGILWMLAAWGLFSVLDTSVKWLVLGGVPALYLAFMRYGVAFALACLQVAMQGRPNWRLGPAAWRLLVLRGVLLGTTTAVNFIALRFLPLTVTSAILFSSPIIVCLLSVPMLGEKVGAWRWGAIVVGFVGVLIVIRPFGADFNWAALLILYNASALALFSILTRKISGTVPSSLQQLTTNGIGTAILVPTLLWVWTVPDSGLTVFLIALIGFCGWAGHEAFSRAHLYGNAAALMPYSYSFLIYVTFTSWLVFGDLPDAATVAGASVITASGLLIWWRENRRRVL